jgi:hypothetical protein
MYKTKIKKMVMLIGAPGALVKKIKEKIFVLKRSFYSLLRN